MGLVLGSYVAEKPDKRKTRSLLNYMGHEEVNQILFKNNLGQSDRNLSFSTLGSRSMQCPEDFHGYTSLPLLRYRCTAISGSLWILCFRILRWPWSYQWSGLPFPVFLSICPGSALTSVTKSSSCWVVLYVQNLYRILKSQTPSVTGRDYLIQCHPHPHLNDEKQTCPAARGGARTQSQTFIPERLIHLFHQ